jgi:hypothetical protein
MRFVIETAGTAVTACCGRIRCRRHRPPLLAPRQRNWEHGQPGSRRLITKPASTAKASVTVPSRSQPALASPLMVSQPSDYPDR